MGTRYRLMRSDGATIEGDYDATDTNTVAIVDFPSPGTYTYTLYVYWDTNNAAPNMVLASMIGIVVKR